MLMLIQHYRRYLQQGRVIHVPAEVEAHIAEQKDENNPMGSWLQENLVKKEGTVHVHRFQKAYKQWQSQQDDPQSPMPRTGFVEMLKSLGHQVSDAKTKDPNCCINKFRTVRDVDVKDWTELGLKKT